MHSFTDESQKPDYKENMLRKYFVFLTCLSFFHSAFAQTPDPEQLGALSEQQRAAEKRAATLTIQQVGLQSEIDALQNGLVRATAQSRGYEYEAGKVSKTLAKLKSEEQSLKAELVRDRDSLANYLAALQRIERNPPPALLASSKSVLDAVRAANLIKTLSLSLHEQSKHLSTRLAKLQTVQSEMLATQIKLTGAAREIDTRLSHIKSNISKKSLLNRKLNTAQKAEEEQAKSLAAEAKNLQELIASFEKQADAINPRLKPKFQGNTPSIPSPILKPVRGKDPPAIYIASQFRRFSDARGKLSLPVLGTLSRKYGARLSNGTRAKGVYLKTRPKAQIVAPFAGRIEFSGDFNNMTVVILNVGNGYFIVLTGLATAYTSAGDLVKAGEPIGLMPKAKTPELFMEFRKNKASIDPTPWIGHALKS